MDTFIAALAANLPQEVRAFFASKPLIQKGENNPRYSYITSEYEWPVSPEEAADLLRGISNLPRGFKVQPTIRQSEKGATSIAFLFPLPPGEVLNLCWACSQVVESWGKPFLKLLLPEITLVRRWQNQAGFSEEWRMSILRLDTAEEFILQGGYSLLTSGGVVSWASTDKAQKVSLNLFFLEGLVQLLGRCKKQNRKVLLSEEEEKRIISFLLADIRTSRRIGIITEADEKKDKGETEACKAA